LYNDRINQQQRDITMNTLDALEILLAAADDFDQAMRNETSVNGSAVNLDQRCYGLHVIDDMIIVHKNNDRSLQYYGGFEYVDSDFRSEFGEWVIYYSDDDRVRECIEYFNEQSEAA
jgi:hypothetical protein